MVEKLYSIFRKSGKVSTDTRSIEPGAIFFALRGPNFNANKLAAEALDKGATAVVLDDPGYVINDDPRYFLTSDVLKLLQDLAAWHRKQLNIPFIGLTGSNGKTTTKELIHAVLSSKYKVLATSGNLNNHIGVPLTILSVTGEHEMAIIEMGANHQGEIAALCRIANPDHGMITNIGKAHLEGFGGFEGVIRGKSELYQHLINVDGTVWINSQNEILSNMGKRFSHPLYYPSEGDFYHCKLISSQPSLEILTENNTTVTTRLVGSYNFENIAAALCIGKYFEVPAEKAEAAIAGYSPRNNRSQFMQKGSNKIIMDAYNANPSSMRSALHNLAQIEDGHKVVILGDMKELGQDSAMEHREIGVLLAGMSLEKIYLLGPEMMETHRACPASSYYSSKDALLAALREDQLKDRLILIKGSRSMKLEEVLEVL